jgi:predicted nucleotidyltransferase
MSEYNDQAPELPLPRHKLQEVLADYKYAEAIAAEAGNVQDALYAQGIDDASLLVFGSAARRELRTVNDDPDHPSDIDTLAIISEGALAELFDRAKGSAVLGRRLTPSGATKVSMKLPSITGLFGPTEVDIYSQAGILQELAGDARGVTNQLVTHALKDGLLFEKDGHLSVAA